MSGETSLKADGSRFTNLMFPRLLSVSFSFVYFGCLKIHNTLRVIILIDTAVRFIFVYFLHGGKEHAIPNDFLICIEQQQQLNNMVGNCP